MTSRFSFERQRPETEASARAKLQAGTERNLERRIGIAVCRLREFGGLTQHKLAELAGISQAAISQIETGKRANNLNTLEQIAGSLGLRLSELMRIAEEPTNVEAFLNSANEALQGEESPVVARRNLTLDEAFEELQNAFASFNAEHRDMVGATTEAEIKVLETIRAKSDAGLARLARDQLKSHR